MPKLFLTGSLGAMPAQLFLGSSARVRRDRGKLQPGNLASWIMATHHPSAILRTPDRAEQERMRREFVSDLRIAYEKAKSDQI